MSLNLKALVRKLNDTSRVALEESAGLCMSRTHYDIAIEHYLLKTLDSSDNDVAAILKHYGIDRARLTTVLQHGLDSLKAGNARSPAFSPIVVKMLAEAWTIGSIEYDAGKVRTGFTLLALLTDEGLAQGMKEICLELKGIDTEDLRRNFYTVVASSREVETGAQAETKTKALLTDDELARLAKALIRELASLGAAGVQKDFQPLMPNLHEVQVPGAGERPHLDPGS